MRTAQQTFHNRTEWPIYISVEVTPECYELEPGETLTIIYQVTRTGDALQVDVINERELVIWPNGEEPTILINGASAEGRSWNFKHS